MANNEENAPIFPLLLFQMRELLSEEVINKQVFNSLKVTKAKSSVNF